MNLKVKKFPVKEVKFTKFTRYYDGTLEVNKEELLTAMNIDNIITGVEMDITYPGESVRIINLLDTIEPRCKVEGKNNVFPGFIGTHETVGSGTTHVLSGLAVMECAEYPQGQGGLLIAREAMVDMSGPCADLTPFGKTVNLVMKFNIEPNREDTEYDSAIRLATLRAAEFLARTTVDLDTEFCTVYNLDQVKDKSLPRILYINQIHSQGPNATTFIYGKSFTENLPTLIHPNEMIDGAIVSGNYVYGCYKTPTYIHCNNPIVENLYRGHGKDHIMLPVVISRGHHYSFSEKLRSAQYAAKISSLLKPDGIIVTQEGGGNSIIESMQTIKACEQLSIPTTTISYEMSLGDKISISLLDSVHEADAIVSSGGTEQKVSLPAVEKVLGGTRLRIGLENISPVGPIELEMLHQIYSASNQTGFGTLTCTSY